MAGWGAKGRNNARERQWEEHRTTGLLNVVVFLAVAAVQKDLSGRYTPPPEQP